MVYLFESKSNAIIYKTNTYIQFSIKLGNCCVIVNASQYPEDIAIYYRYAFKISDYLGTQKYWLSRLTWGRYFTNKF